MAEAEAEPDAVPADGKILDDDATVCPDDLIWAQKADEDAPPLINAELLEGKSSESKARREASLAAMPRAQNRTISVVESHDIFNREATSPGQVRQLHEIVRY